MGIESGVRRLEVVMSSRSFWGSLLGNGEGIWMRLPDAFVEVILFFAGFAAHADNVSRLVSQDARKDYSGSTSVDLTLFHIVNRQKVREVDVFDILGLISLK